jgi:hypothetical protein
MDIVVISNGLGNQMSQYAFYLKKKAINKNTIYIVWGKAHNGYELDNLFNIAYKKKKLDYILLIIFRVLAIERFSLLSNVIRCFFFLFNCRIVKENFKYDYNSNFLKSHRGLTFYHGGWHCEEYFFSEKKTILKLFTFPNITGDNNITPLVRHINMCNSVSIHIRRGDYLNKENIGMFGNVCTKEYFRKAIESIMLKVSNPHFFIFSNDFEWVMENIEIDNSICTYVNYNNGESSWKDMYLMSLCKHNIISNSTFSWWGAWLNKNENKIIISPSRFLNNDVVSAVYSKDWIKI